MRQWRTSNWVCNNLFAYLMDSFTNYAFSIVRHKTYSKDPNMPLKMKEDVTMLHIGEKFSGSFDELSSLDDVEEEPNCCDILLFEMFVDVCGILDIETSGLNEGLIFYFV
jgi:hypothetical protein